MKTCATPAASLTCARCSTASTAASCRTRCRRRPGAPSLRRLHQFRRLHRFRPRVHRSSFVRGSRRLMRRRCRIRSFPDRTFPRRRPFHRAVHQESNERRANPNRSSQRTGCARRRSACADRTARSCRRAARWRVADAGAASRPRRSRSAGPRPSSAGTAQTKRCGDVVIWRCEDVIQEMSARKSSRVDFATSTHRHIATFRYAKSACIGCRPSFSASFCTSHSRPFRRRIRRPQRQSKSCLKSKSLSS